jgi:WD40 repeat protein
LRLLLLVPALLIGGAVAVALTSFLKFPEFGPSKPREEVDEAVVDGVTLQVQYRPGSEKYEFVRTGDGLTVLRGEDRLDYLGGIPFVNGTAFPSPSRGDTVRWNLDGPLLINDQAVPTHRFQPKQLANPATKLAWKIRDHAETPAPRDSLAADWSRAGRVLVTAHGDGAARVWDADKGEVRTVLAPEPPPGARDLWGLRAAVSPDGKTVATANVRAAAVVLWEADTGKQIATLSEPVGNVTDLRFASDRCLLEARGGKLYARDLSGDRSKVRELAEVHSGLPAAFAFAAGILAANDGRRVTLSRPPLPGGPPAEPLAATVEGTTSEAPVALSPDGAVLAAATSPGKLAVYDVAGRKPPRTLWWRPQTTGRPAAINCLTFFQDGKTLAVGTVDGLRLYDVETGRERGWISTLALRSLAASGDGVSLAATAEHGNVVYLWPITALQPQ